MGRELRRVSADWQHPEVDGRGFKPLFDESFEDAMTEWLVNADKWMRGEARYQDSDDERTWKAYVEVCGVSPDPQDYRPAWTEEERTHYQVYENVSQGTPVSPVLASEEEVIEWWVKVGDDFNGRLTREEAERWIGYGSSPSMFIVGGRIVPGAKL